MAEKAIGTNRLHERRYYNAPELVNAPIDDEFLERVQDTQGHDDQITERIVQLNGQPDFNSATPTVE
jgi:bacterioferritin